MSQDPRHFQRRTILQIATALAATAGGTVTPTARGAVAPAATGTPNDFNFLRGEWKIANRRLEKDEWQSFEGEATVHRILAGVGSVEELRIPARKFSGMGLRLLDVERRLWADYWVNSKSGVLTPPPSWGSFVNGVGTWDSEEMDGDTPVIYRGVWDQIKRSSCRWYQASSRDGGKSWQENWVMHWKRR